MKHYVVPMLALVRAKDAQDALEKAHAAALPERTAPVMFLSDERLDPWAYDPGKWEPHSVLDRAECEDAGA